MICKKGESPFVDICSCSDILIRRFFVAVILFVHQATGTIIGNTFEATILKQQVWSHESWPGSR
jgi:hypothetical protein